MDDSAAAKKAAAAEAAKMVESGMKIGLGTGSTTAIVLEIIGRRIREEDLQVVGTPTSSAASRLAHEHDIPLKSLTALKRLDIALDGADEIDPRLTLVKGRGAAHTIEKIVASAADRFVVLADDSKLVEQLGSRMPVPVEIVPLAISLVEDRIRHLGGEPRLRMAERKDGPVVTDLGFWILDVDFDSISDAAALSSKLSSIPGVLDHGLFVDMATDALIGRGDGTVEHLTAPEKK